MKLPRYKPPRDDYEPKTSTGGLNISRKAMQPPAKTACAECPLRRDAAPGRLGGYSPEMYVGILHSPASIACHMAGDVRGPIELQRHCVGVCAYRSNVGLLPNIDGFPTGAASAVLAVGKDAQFFESPETFVDHHHGRKP